MSWLWGGDSEVCRSNYDTLVWILFMLYNLIGGVQCQRLCVSRFGTSPPMSKPSMNALTLEFKHAILFLNVCLNNMMVDTSVYTGCRNVDTHIICVWCGTGQPLSELYLRV